MPSKNLCFTDNDLYYDSIIEAPSNSFFFGSILYALSSLQLNSLTRVVLFNLDSIPPDNCDADHPSLEFAPLTPYEIICGAFFAQSSIQSYGAWTLNKSFISPKLTCLPITASVLTHTKFNRYVCNSNILSLPAFLLNEFNIGFLRYTQTYLDFVVSLQASRLGLPLRVVPVPYEVSRHDQDIYFKFTSRISAFSGLQSPFNPLLFGIKVRSIFFPRTLLPFLLYRLFLHFKSVFNNLSLI